MKKLAKQKKILILGIVLIVYTLIVTPILFINLQRQQDTRGRAQIVTPSASPVPQNESVQWATTQTAQSQCLLTGFAQIGVSFTNTETSRSMNVTATDQSSGSTINMGTIPAQQTVTGTISPNKTSLPAGTVVYKLAWTDTPSQTDQRTASYNAITCHPPSPTPTPIQNTCGNVATDTMLLIDRSGSMGQANKLVEAKNAAKNFVDIISKDTRNRVGLVSFSTKATVNSSLTTNYASVKSQIDSLSASGYTCQQCGIDAVNQEIAAHKRAGIKQVVVMLTDGQANWVEGGTNSVSASVAEPPALSAVRNGFSANGEIFFTIGLGDPNATGDARFFDATFLQNIAALTGGVFYFPLPDQLNGVYQQISQLIGKGVIGGFVFNDANGNAAYDQGEQKQSGWKIILSSTMGTQTVTSDSTGSFKLSGLCDGNYTLKEVLQPGWQQTLPGGSGSYSINIINANQFTNKNFGNMLIPTPTPTPKPRCSDGIDNDNNGLTDANDSTCHTDGNPKNPNSYDPGKDGEHGGNTCDDGKDNNNNGLIDGADPVCHTDGNANNPKSYNPFLPEVSPTATPTPKPTFTPSPTLTPTPALTEISLTVLLDGIGNRGDNANPTASSLSNKDPKHKTRTADIQVFSSQNKLVAQGDGTLTYNSTDGDYTGSVFAGSYLPSGVYTVKVKTDTHLRKLVSGIQTITLGKKNTLPSTALVTGDVNNDNVLNILDYNTLLDCYSDLAVAVNCTSIAKKNSADFNDDGFVNQVDYNLFIREISTQPGE